MGVGYLFKPSADIAASPLLVLLRQLPGKLLARVQVKRAGQIAVLSGPRGAIRVRRSKQKRGIPVEENEG